MAVECANFEDGICDLLAIGADVLDGRAADLSGDPGEALDACHVEREGVVDEGGLREAVGVAQMPDPPSKSSCRGWAWLTRVPGATEWVSHTLPPMIVRSPLTVSPPTMVEFA